MYSFSDLGSVCYSMSSSNCCFFPCIQISQEAGEVVWYSHLFKNLSQFVVIHSKRLWCSQESKSRFFFFFLELSCFFSDTMLAIWSLVLLLFLNPAWTSGSSWFMYCWSLAWRILSITLPACTVVWSFFGIAFLCDWNENWPFPVPWPLLRFPDLLAYWVQHFHSIIFQDLK